MEKSQVIDLTRKILGTLEAWFTQKVPGCGDKEGTLVDLGTYLTEKYSAQDMTESVKNGEIPLSFDVMGNDVTLQINFGDTGVYNSVLNPDSEIGIKNRVPYFAVCQAASNLMTQIENAITAATVKG